MSSLQDINSPAIRELAERSIPHKIFQHPGPIHSLEQAAQERSETPEQVVRSLLFRLSGDEFIMILAGGPQQVSWKALRDYLGLSRMTMAADEEVLTVTGAVPGTVSPFGLPAPLRILIDEAILSQPEVSLGSGIRGVAILIHPQDLLKAIPGVEVIRLEKKN